MLALWRTAGAQIPVLESSLRRHIRLNQHSSSSSSDTSSSLHRRAEREAQRLLGLVSQLREDAAGRSSTGEDAGNGCLDVVQPFVEVLKSPAVSSTVKACAVECLERIVSAMPPGLESAVPAVSLVCDALLECRLDHYASSSSTTTMSSTVILSSTTMHTDNDNADDEVAKIWLLEGLAACCRFTHPHGMGALLSEDLLFRVVDCMFEASTTPFSSDVVRSCALRLLGKLVRDLFSLASLFFGTDDPQLQLTCRRTFLYLVEMADPEHSASAQHHPLPHHASSVSWTRFVSLRLLVEACLASSSHHHHPGDNDNDNLKNSNLSPSSSLGVTKDSALLEIIKDDLMRTLVQTAQRALNQDDDDGTNSNDASSASRLPVLAEALRLANLLLGDAECRQVHLRVQFECFFNAVYCRVLERAVSPKHRTDEAVLVLESLCDLLSSSASGGEQDVLLDAFCGLDLALQGTDLFETLLKLLARLAHPAQLSVPALDPFRLLSLRALLAALRSLSSSSSDSDDDAAAEYAQAAAHKQRKAALTRCAEAFNTKPSRGVQALVAEGVLQPAPHTDALVLASFLRNTPTLDKVAVGQFLGEEAELNRLVLHRYTETFDVRGRSLVASLRSFLECFRLPKEAQQIDRIIQAFADVAFAQCADASHFPSVDACYLLCFATIMLNTDLHNPNIRPERKMTLQQFSHNNRNYGQDISQGRDFSGEFLRGIYDAILKREINTLKDGSSLTAQVSSDKWWDLLSRSRSSPEASSSAVVRGGGQGYKRYMFGLVWKHALVAVKVVFASGQPSEQPDALHQALDGFLVLAKCAAQFASTQAFDCVVCDLCMFTSLLVYEDEQRMSRGGGGAAALDFAVNHKGQMAAMSVFALTRKFGSSMRRGWRFVLGCVLRLTDLGLLRLDSTSTSSASSAMGVAFADFHEQVRDTVLQAHDVTMQLKRKSASSSSTGAAGAAGGGGVVEEEQQSWGAWLLGIASPISPEEEARAYQAWLDADEEHRACMSALRVADALLLLKEGEDEDAEGQQPPLEEEEGEEIQYALECVKSCRPLGLVRDSAHLSDDALVALMDALLQTIDSSSFSALPQPQEAAATTNSPSNEEDLDMGLLCPPSLGSRLVAVHLLAEICLANNNTSSSRCALAFSPKVKRVLLGMAKTSSAAASKPSFQLELVCVSLLRVACSSLEDKDGGSVLLELAHTWMGSLPGLDALLGKVVMEWVSSRDDFWLGDGQPGDALLGVLKAIQRSTPLAMDALLVCSSKATRAEQRQLVAFACREMTAGVGVVKLCEAALLSSSNEEEERLFILDELAGLANSSSSNGDVDTRRAALQALVRGVCQLPAGSLSAADFARLVLSNGDNDDKPLLPRCELVVKSFLHHAPPELLAESSSSSTAGGYTELWASVLELLEQCKQSGGDGGVAETCTELLKNLLLALSSHGILSKSKVHFVVTGQPQVQEQEEEEENAHSVAFWEATWAVLDRCPALLKDLHELPSNAIDLRDDEQ